MAQLEPGVEGVVLGLDIGRVLGWCDSRTPTLPSSVKLRGLGFADANRYVAGLMLGVTAVVIEDVRWIVRGGHARTLLLGLRGVILRLAEDYSVPVFEVPPNTLKLWATGSGRASKEMMVASAQQRGYTGVSHDEADAMLLVAYAKREVEVAVCWK